MNMYRLELTAESYNQLSTFEDLASQFHSTLTPDEWHHLVKN